MQQSLERASEARADFDHEFIAHAGRFRSSDFLRWNPLAGASKRPNDTPELQQPIVVAVMDVNAEKRAEGKSLQDAHEFRRIIDAIPQAIMVYSPDGQPVYINRVALEYAGLSIEEVRADSFHDRVVHPEDIERLREARQNALSRGAPFEYELRALKKGGQYCWNLIQYNPQTDEQGRIVRWFATATDIDDRRSGRAAPPKRKRCFA